MATTDPYQFIADQANASASAAKFSAQQAATSANIATSSAATATLAANRANIDARNANISATFSANYAAQAQSLVGAVRTANTSTIQNVTTLNTSSGPTGALQMSNGSGGFVSSNVFVTGFGTITAGNLSVSSGTVTAGQIFALGNIISNSNVTALRGVFSTAVLGNASIGNLTVLGNVSGNFSGNGSNLSGVAPLNSPTFTGFPTAPTPANNTNTTQIATTQFVQNVVSGITGFSTGMNVTGNISATGTINATVGVTAVGNVQGGNLRTVGVITATGNLSAGNAIINGLVTATGNIRGANVFSNGVFSTTGNAVASNVFANYVFSNGVVCAIGNIGAQGNISTSGSLTANGNLRTFGTFIMTQVTRTSSSPGFPGQICWDTGYIYVCIASNVWRRVPLSNF